MWSKVKEYQKPPVGRGVKPPGKGCKKSLVREVEPHRLRKLRETPKTSRMRNISSKAENKKYKGDNKIPSNSPLRKYKRPKGNDN